jgi:hypothetical protein
LIVVMTAVEVYELTTKGGASDFVRLIEICQVFGPYCIIGGLAVNCYVEPVYTVDAAVVVTASSLDALTERLEAERYKIERHPHSVNALPASSDLRVQFTTDPRYQDFLPRSMEADVLGVRARVACLEDVARGKLWAYRDPARRLSKRKKDELDLIRLAEAYPELRTLYPPDLLDQIDRG